MESCHTALPIARQIAEDGTIQYFSLLTQTFPVHLLAYWLGYIAMPNSLHIPKQIQSEMDMCFDLTAMRKRTPNVHLVFREASS